MDVRRAWKLTTFQSTRNEIAEASLGMEMAVLSVSSAPPMSSLDTIFSLDRERSDWIMALFSSRGDKDNAYSLCAFSISTASSDVLLQRAISPERWAFHRNDTTLIGSISLELM